MKAFQNKTEILDNFRVSGRYFKIILESSRISGEAHPGQFVMVQINNGYEPLLRRPFGIHRIGPRFSVLGSQTKNVKIKANTLEILYEIVGRGTQILSQKKRGEYLNLIGPLGEGFAYRTPNTEYRIPILVAGGMGIAPLLFLAERLIHSLPTNVQEKPLVLIGARTKEGILCEKDFKRLGCIVHITTDDGTKGYKGRVTDLLRELLSTIDHRLSTIYACGPKPMLKELALISKRYTIPAQVSLEAHMACGIGACLGCTISTKYGFRRVCKEGPVFNADEIIL